MDKFEVGGRSPPLPVTYPTVCLSVYVDSRPNGLGGGTRAESKWHAKTQTTILEEKSVDWVICDDTEKFYFQLRIEANPLHEQKQEKPKVIYLN